MKSTYTLTCFTKQLSENPSSDEEAGNRTSSVVVVVVVEIKYLYCLQKRTQFQFQFILDLV